MSEETETSAFKAAYLRAEALSDAERPKPERKKPSKTAPVAPNLKFDTTVQYRRENSAEVSEQLADQIEAQGGRLTVRRPTIHVEPFQVRAEIFAEEEQKRALIGRLRTQAVKAGRSWSKWINGGRSSGWRHIDPTLTNSWADLMAATGEYELETRLTVIEQFAGGMELSLDDINIYAYPTKFGNDRNRVDYVERMIAQVGKMDQLTVSRILHKGTNREGLPVRGTRTGGFLCISFEHLSGYSGKPQLLEQFRGFMMSEREEAETEKPFTARVGSAIIAAWIGHEDVRTDFQRRQV